MPTTLESRKPNTKLTRADFEAFPIWEYVLDEEGDDGRDETWVRPVDRMQIPRNQYSLLVATDFTTAGGRNLFGFMVITTARDPIEITPGVIIGRGLYLVLPTLTRREAVRKKAPWQLKDRDDLIRKLRLKEDELFPLSYDVRLPIRGEKQARSGYVR